MNLPINTSCEVGGKYFNFALEFVLLKRLPNLPHHKE
jgi:hypothetical protein